MANEKTVAIYLTKSQCRSLADFIDFHLIGEIRDNLDIDNLIWVKDMVDAYAVFRANGDDKDGK